MSSLTRVLNREQALPMEWSQNRVLSSVNTLVIFCTEYCEFLLIKLLKLLLNVPSFPW